MEERQKVKTIQVDYKCPRCPTGYLRPTGIVCDNNPPTYPHKCNNPDCDYSKIMKNKKYPYIEYEPHDSSVQIREGNNIFTIKGSEYINKNGRLIPVRSETDEDINNEGKEKNKDQYKQDK